ncbi:MAG: hypothetical protein Q8942_15230, partial [Bacillota bacterium]|nr:hypothetical protein [Bacillota bacterium]
IYLYRQSYLEVNERITDLDEVLASHIIANHEMVVLVNSLQSVKKIKILVENLPVSIKKQLNICYTCFNEQADAITIIVNPDIDNVDNWKIKTAVFFGSWMDLAYVDQFVTKLDDMGIECIYLFDDNSADISEIIPVRQDIEAVYRYIRSCHKNELLYGNIYLLAKNIASQYKISMNYFKFKKCIEILDELKLINRNFEDNNNVRILFRSGIKGKTSLENSGLYRNLQLYKKTEYAYKNI